MQLTVRYFARLREAFATEQETVQLAAGVDTVAGLLALLSARGGVWADELAAGRVFRVALDQELVHADAALHEGAEVAIFPPVTGG